MGFQFDKSYFKKRNGFFGVWFLECGGLNHIQRFKICGFWKVVLRWTEKTYLVICRMKERESYSLGILGSKSLVTNLDR